MTVRFDVEDPLAVAAVGERCSSSVDRELPVIRLVDGGLTGNDFVIGKTAHRSRY